MAGINKIWVAGAVMVGNDKFNLGEETVKYWRHEIGKLGQFEVVESIMKVHNVETYPSDVIIWTRWEGKADLVVWVVLNYNFEPTIATVPVTYRGQIWYRNYPAVAGTIRMQMLFYKKGELIHHYAGIRRHEFLGYNSFSIVWFSQLMDLFKPEIFRLLTTRKEIGIRYLLYES